MMTEANKELIELFQNSEVAVKKDFHMIFLQGEGMDDFLLEFLHVENGFHRLIDSINGSQTYWAVYLVFHSCVSK